MFEPYYPYYEDNLKPGKQRWCYKTETVFCFYSTMELCNREEKLKNTKQSVKNTG